MAQSEIKRRIEVERTRFAFIFFPVATYTKVGALTRFTVLGMPVYRSVGDEYKWLWFKTKKRK